MGWWKAEPQPVKHAALSPQPDSFNSGSQETTKPPSTSSCPVDSRSREIWLQQSLASQQQQNRIANNKRLKVLPHGDFPSRDASRHCSSDRISQPTIQDERTSHSSPPRTARDLSYDRVISSIPRAYAGDDSSNLNAPFPAQRNNTPSNSEVEAGTHPSGNWVYPSQHQFFTAILRKHNPEALVSPGSSSPISSRHPTAAAGLLPQASDTGNGATDALAATMPTIISIHNAVNERAWSMIQSWEHPFTHDEKQNKELATYHATKPTSSEIQISSTNTTSKSPRLLSFRGLGSGPPPSSPSSGISGLLSDYLTLLNPTTPLTPKARLNGFLGYQIPFDRHDWRLQRADGTEVEYVIDFYAGNTQQHQFGGTSSGGDAGGLMETSAGRWGRMTQPKQRERSTMPAAGHISFYLDVRPKLNSWEGWKTRLLWPLVAPAKKSDD